MLSNIKQIKILLLSFAISFILLIIIFGYENISFTNINWITSFDTKSDFIALKFFLNDEWRFPFGLNPNYGRIENSIVFSGAVPILSFITKIFKDALVKNFHYFQFWIFLCLSLQYFYSYKIISLFTKKRLHRFFSALFFLFLPFLYYRLSVHLSLAAHWIILAYLYYEFKNSNNSDYKKISLIILSSLVHFYLTIMLLILRFVFDLDKIFKVKKIKKIFLNNILLISSLILIMFLSGYFVIPSTDTLGYGFGIYKFNIASFFDPIPSGTNQKWSLLISDIPNFKGEHEGFAYLGIGVIILFLLTIYYSIKNRSIINIKKKYIFLLLILLLLSISNNVSFANYNLINLQLPNILYGPLSIVRASGRFIWPFIYILMIFSFFIIIKNNLKLRFIIILLIIQILDTSFLFKKELFAISDRNNFNENIFEEIINQKNIISTYSSDNSNIFFDTSDLIILGNYKSTNIFRLGRYNRSQQSIERDKLYKKFYDKSLDNETIYVVENIDHLRHLNYLLKDTNHLFKFLNKTWFILPNQKNIIDFNDQHFFNQNLINQVKKSEKYFPRFKDPSGFLGLGWSHGSYGKNLDFSSVWSEGSNSFLIFNYDKITEIDYLELEISKIMKNKSKNLNVEIYLNNTHIDSLVFKKNKEYKHILHIKNYLNDGINEIRFNILNPTTPVSKLESVDGRLLGFNLKSFKFM